MKTTTPVEEKEREREGLERGSVVGIVVLYVARGKGVWKTAEKERRARGGAGVWNERGLYFLKTLTLQPAAKPRRGNQAAAYIYSFSFGYFSKGASPWSSLGVKMRSYSVLPKGLTSHAVIHTPAPEHLVWGSLAGWFTLGWPSLSLSLSLSLPLSSREISFRRFDLDARAQRKRILPVMWILVCSRFLERLDPPPRPLCTIDSENRSAVSFLFGILSNRFATEFAGNWNYWGFLWEPRWLRLALNLRSFFS